MAYYNRVKTPKFYIDAVLLARQLGYINEENNIGKYYLNPTNTTDVVIPSNGQQTISIYLHRYFLNSLTHCFVLGHQFLTDNILADGYIKIDPYVGLIDDKRTIFSSESSSTNGFSLFEGDAGGDLAAERFTLELNGTADTLTPIGDISIGWSYTMPHSPDLELTQTFGNESLKTVNTKGGHTLTNTGWNQPPKWGNYPQWNVLTTNIAYPSRRSWSLKFSYLNDTDMMPEYYNNYDINDNRGIFEKTGGSVDAGTETFSIKDNFLSKVFAGTNGFQLPFIFQPDSTVEEYAIARVNANSVTMNQVANNVYDISLDIIEVW